MTYTEQQIRDIAPGTGLDALVERSIMKTKKVPKFYSTDMDAAMVVESEISEDDELLGRYVFALMDIVGIEDPDVPPSPDDIFALIHASAADRCRAALLAIGCAEQ
ncbi:hypothetical protein [Paenibacillus tyrfis]|uniref:hypothetical protein n=1 Tax=Paenibacillus tyrfis TaxID=1501230 RepID=UPI00209D6236|nr:hypothetical protein [Paenibacillus tyrfis]MCP1306420.1 hypothetical protein [Paenibacillus tyrfis]